VNEPIVSRRKRQYEQVGHEQIVIEAEVIAKARRAVAGAPDADELLQIVGLHPDQEQWWKEPEHENDR
jgi:hypothetical protein